MSHFSLSFEAYDLKLHQPFTISRGTKDAVHNVLIRLQKDGITGLGEAGPNSRYNEDSAKVFRYLESLPKDFFDDIETGDQLAAKLENHHPDSVAVIKSAQAAVEMAWLDWWGKSQNKPLWKLWNASKSTGPVTSYTIGLDNIDVMQQKVRDASEYPVYKVKLGTDRDRTIIRALREVTDKPIRVDANEGWTTLKQAREMVTFLADQNIELIEQPMPAAQIKDIKKLKKNSPLPLCADESFEGNESLAEIAEAFDIINIKLMKIGSLVEARHIIKEAKTYGLDVMIGCMIESSIANAAGGLLSLWAEYADLDGHLLIEDDPASGFELTDKKQIRLSEEPGLGVALR